MTTQPPRFEARTRAIRDTRLTAGARVVYMDLDDRARQDGWIRKTRFELALGVGFSIRHWARYLNELTVAGYVTLDRSRLSTYVLTWSKRDAGVPSQGAKEDTGVLREGTRASFPVAHGPVPCPLGNTKDTSIQVDRSTWPVLCDFCGTPHSGEQPVRCNCGRSIYPAQETRVDPVLAVQTLIGGLANHAGLRWPPPDEAICLRILAAAGGDVAEAYWIARDAVVGRRKSPGENYAWFVSVIANRRKSA